MPCEKRFYSCILIASLLMFLNFGLPNGVSAQATPQATVQDKPVAQDAKTQDNVDATPASPLGATWVDSYIRQIGTSGLLAGNRQGIGWGSLYIPSAELSGIVDRFDGTSTVPPDTFTAMVLQTTVVYDHKIGSSRLALQYQPSMAISEGRVVRDFSNQNTSLDMLIYSRPRWNVRFSDNFHYYYGQRSIGFPYFDVNPATSGAVTNNFLESASRWISNTAFVSVGYALSQRSSISVTPTYTFSESGEGASAARGALYGGSVNWDYRTSERQTIGLVYTGQLIHEAASSSGNPSTDTVFHTIAATTGRRLSATWYVRGNLGVTTSAQSQSRRQWSLYAAAGLLKQFGWSSLGLNYSRGDTLASGLISNVYSDRIDATYQNQTNRRLNWSIGGGYLRQVQSGGFSGWYTSSNAQFLLAPRAGLFLNFGYSHKNQAENTGSLFSGNRDTFVFGLLWQPGRVAH